MGMKTTKVQKLVPNLMDKKNYIVHIRNLQLYVKHGLRLKKIHRVLQFTQKKFMESYIALNTRLRQKATSTARSNQCKLMNNAVFGKTMENVRHYKRIELVTKLERFRKLAKDPLYIRHAIFNENLIAVHRETKSITLNKPMAIGFSVLDLSKVLMYQHHYEHVMPKYGADRARLLFTDTDSLCYEIQTDDIYKDMAEDAHLYDFSGYDRQHPNFSMVNKKVIGKMSDETNGKPIQEFCGLRSKMYSVKMAEREMKRAKGVKKAVVKKHIHHEDYCNVLDKGILMRHQMTMFRSSMHDIFTVTNVKISLSAFDNKRFLLCDGIDSFAYGHYATLPLEDEEEDELWRPWV